MTFVIINSCLFTHAAGSLREEIEEEKNVRYLIEKQLEEFHELVKQVSMFLVKNYCYVLLHWLFPH